MRSDMAGPTAAPYDAPPGTDASTTSTDPTTTGSRSRFDAGISFLDDLGRGRGRTTTGPWCNGRRNHCWCCCRRRPDLPCTAGTSVWHGRLSDGTNNDTFPAADRCAPEHTRKRTGRAREETTSAA